MSDAPAAEPLVLGIDGGNSKVDCALARADGTLLGGRARSHGLASGGRPGAGNGAARRSGAAASGTAPASRRRSPTSWSRPSLAPTIPEDVRLLERSIGGLDLGREVIVLNDTFGALRAGRRRGWGVGLVCGQGINAGAIAPDWQARPISGRRRIRGRLGRRRRHRPGGDQAAVRGSDGRGPRTSLERSVPAFFGVKTPAAMTRAFYFERIPRERASTASRRSSSPRPLRATRSRARSSTAWPTSSRRWPRALIRRLRMTQLEVEVVLAGGVFRTDDAEFYARLDDGLRRAAPRARTIKLDAPPVAGAVLLGLDELARRGRTHTPRHALDDCSEHAPRAALRDWDAEP